MKMYEPSKFNFQYPLNLSNSHNFITKMTRSDKVAKVSLYLAYQNKEGH